MIQNGATNLQLSDEDFPTFILYYRGLNYYRLMTEKPRYHEMNIIVCLGPTGTGKSKWAYDNYPNAYWKQNSQWWDNYTNQDTVIIDEFYGWLPWSDLLRLCDRYPYMVQSKHGQLTFNSSTIVFTSNSLPSSWYKNMYMPAFERRVNSWKIFPDWADQKDFTLAPDAYRYFLQNDLPLFNFPPA